MESQPTRYAPLYLCQRSFYKIFVKFRNSKKNVLKIVLFTVNINKDEKWFVIVFNFYLRKIVLQKVWVGGSFLSLREFIWNEWFIFIFIDIYNN